MYVTFSFFPFLSFHRHGNTLYALVYLLVMVRYKHENDTYSFLRSHREYSDIRTVLSNDSE